MIKCYFHQLSKNWYNKIIIFKQGITAEETFRLKYNEIFVEIMKNSSFNVFAYNGFGYIKKIKYMQRV